jgi:DNA replicative helicase MCM subunit Mcm2 (Cdc46/Mcm family)
VKVVWETFRCEDCGLEYAIKQQEANEIEEPACSSCGCDRSAREEVVEWTTRR